MIIGISANPARILQRIKMINLFLGKEVEGGELGRKNLLKISNLINQLKKKRRT